jgi:DNA-binding LacI/PurR family transcriptional regulator
MTLTPREKMAVAVAADVSLTTVERFCRCGETALQPKTATRIKAAIAEREKAAPQP